MSPPFTANWRSSSTACCSKGSQSAEGTRLTHTFRKDAITRGAMSQRPKYRPIESTNPSFSATLVRPLRWNCTSEGDEARQTETVGQNYEFHGLQTRTRRQQAAVQELQHAVHTCCAGIGNGYLENTHAERNQRKTSLATFQDNINSTLQWCRQVQWATLAMLKKMLKMLKKREKATAMFARTKQQRTRGPSLACWSYNAHTPKAFQQWPQTQQ